MVQWYRLTTVAPIQESADAGIFEKALKEVVGGGPDGECSPGQPGGMDIALFEASHSPVKQHVNYPPHMHCK